LPRRVFVMAMRLATAEWADPAEVEEKYEYRPGTVWLGRSENDFALGHIDDRHVCLVAGSRGGKGTSSIVPTLITWPGSAVILDPKGENATVTAARRGSGSKNAGGMGQSVRVLDPFRAAVVDDTLRASFNPLDALNPEDEEAVDEAGRVADAIVVVREGGANADPFWDESARSMIKGLILHVLTAPQYAGRRNLITVRQLIMRGDWESAETLRADGETNIPPAHGLLWAGVSSNPAFGGLVAGFGDSFTNMFVNSPKQYESVLQVANRNTEFIDSPGMQRMLGGSDFQLSELKTRPEGLSLYLCLPQRYMSTHYRWLRMMIALTVTEMEKVRGRPAAGHPVLLMLDEFAGLKFMQVILDSVAQAAGHGLKMAFVLQSLEQLKAVYKDNWETFLANSGLKIFFNVEDHFTRDYVSKLIGETEVVRDVRSQSDTVGESESVSRSTARSTSTSTSETAGTSSSVSKGRSWGINSSKTRSFNWSSGRNWEYGGFLGGKRWMGGNEGKSDGRSYTDGKSKGWNEGTTDGTSRSTSTSRTEGVTETEGVTHGTSKSRTDGTSETIQKRPLITPDEIGQAFARVDDKTSDGYPGLALAVVAGARPFALRRINYFEDYQFIGFFDPHPDHPLMPWKDLTVSGQELASLVEPFKLRIGAWTRPPGLIAASGDEVAAVVSDLKELAAASMVAPRAGLVTSINGNEGPVPAGPLFSLRYYEDGAALTDPFAQIRAMCEKLRGLPKARTPLKLKWGRIGAIAAALVLVLLVIGALNNSRNDSGYRSQRTDNNPPPVRYDPPPKSSPPVEKSAPAPPAENSTPPAPAVEAAKPAEPPMVEVQICVPQRLIDQAWDSPQLGSKMEAFRTAVLDEVRLESKMKFNPDEFEWTLDQRNSFPRFAAGTAVGYGRGEIDPRDLLTARDSVEGRPHVCPAGTMTEKLLVERR